ncbi:MAG: DNA-protecting protein DprA [Xanthomonadales bacterium]|nr:DNA-processing protein DprA [Gammaproteobacteria bacterium]NNE06902.1 DNA-protecting protein DprA [Xanthomonadales bacterium]NNL96435.1 DNA-protecting protein DprA [Xanthomonadales bacterium]
MSDQHETLESWLRAIRAPGLSGRNFIDALDAAGSIEALVSASFEGAHRLSSDTRDALKNPDQSLIDADLSWLAGERCTLITWDDDRYPSLLRRVPSPPAALFVEGNPDVLWLPQLAVIGSRNPTAGGLDHARQFTAELVRNGMAITSGLAAGIDSASHAAALDNDGVTVAVCGTGPDIVYPSGSKALAERIAQAGALVTEFPSGTAPKRSHFPSRNRIISGLSLGVLVIEAGLNSGTLITARQAAEQGREVFALPGSLHNPLVKGCHRLIKEGARLVETVQDIVSELAPMAGQLASDLRQELKDDDEKQPNPAGQQAAWPEDPDYQALKTALAFDSRTVDELVQLSGLSARAVSSMLLMLDLQGKVNADGGGRYSLSN